MSDQKSFKSLLIRCIITLVACISVSVYQYITLSNISSNAIHQLSDTYMDSFSSQLESHLASIFDYKLNQISTLCQTVTWESVNENKMFQTLTYNARYRDVDSLLLMREDGTLYPIYGDDITVHNAESVSRVLRDNSQKIALGYTTGLERMVLICMPINYVSSANERFIAFVAARDADSLIRDMTVSNTIPVMCGLWTSDGTYVTGTFTEDVRDQAIDLVSDMLYRDDIDYTDSLNIPLQNGIYKVYFSKVPFTTWTLTTCIDYTTLNSTLNSMSTMFNVLSLICGVLIISMIAGVAWYYIKVLQRQLKAVRKLHIDLQEATDLQKVFLSNLSHDIRTPMNGIVGMILLAQNNIEDINQTKYYLDKLDTTSQYLLGLVNNLLDLSKIEQEGLELVEEPISLYNLLLKTEDVMLSNIQGKHQQFLFDVDTVDSNFVWCDSNRLQQVLINILSNSVKYTDEYGTIKLSCNTLSSDEEYLTIQIVIDDNGIGMSDEFQNKVFEAFAREDIDRTTKNNGAGIGLTITNYIVRLMNGEIKVNSELGKGTQFIVELKLRKVSTELVEAAYKELDMEAIIEEEIDYDSVDVTSKRVLVAEDNELNYEILSELLLCFDLELTWAVNGKVAVDTFAASEINYFDVILMDLRMPVMTGYQAAEEIRKLKRADAATVPIIALSADSFEEDIKRCMDCGMNAHTSKPVNIEEVLLLIKKHIYHREV